MRKNKVLLLLFVFSVCLIPGQIFAQGRIGNIISYIDDDLAVIQPEVFNPLSRNTYESLHSGLPISMDFEVELSSGLNKREFRIFRVVIQYNIWRERYRVTTPLIPLVIKDYDTLQKFFRESLALTFPAKELPSVKNLEVRVRVREAGVIPDKQRADVGNRLGGMAKWLFKQSDRDKMSEWSLPVSFIVTNNGEKR